MLSSDRFALQRHYLPHSHHFLFRLRTHQTLDEHGVVEALVCNAMCVLAEYWLRLASLTIGVTAHTMDAASLVVVLRVIF